MKILHTVQNYWPSIGGMQEVVRQLSERMVQAGHDITVATSRHPLRNCSEWHGVNIVDFNISGNSVIGMTGEIERYRDFVLKGEFDVIANFAAQQWATDALLPVLDRIRTGKVFIPTGFSYLHDERYRNYYRVMPEWLRQYDINIFLSATYRDIDFARRHGITNTVLIPNGAAEDEFLAKPQIEIRAILGIPREHFLVLHVGSHSGLKGHTEAIRIFGKSRLRHASLLLVGNDDGPGTGCIDDCRRRSRQARFNPFWCAADKHLLVVELDRVATVAAFHTADILLFPSRVECSPLVLFEAMASRTPFLTTDVGNAAEIIDWTGGGVLLPTERDDDGFHRAVINGSVRLLDAIWQDAAWRDRLAEDGFAAWRKQFTWEMIVRRYEALYLELSQRRAVNGGL